MAKDYDFDFLTDFANYLQKKRQRDDAARSMQLAEAIYCASAPIHNKKGKRIYSSFASKKIRLIRSFIMDKPISLYEKLKARKKKKRKKGIKKAV